MGRTNVFFVIYFGSSYIDVFVESSITTSASQYMTFVEGQITTSDCNVGFWPEADTLTSRSRF